ncbi:GMC family oxidoreductase N-terminal domain-containing protein [Kineococcus aurantiacus]
MRSADVVVVGGGTAGCVVAVRLSSDPSMSVTLLEEGAAAYGTDRVHADVLDAGRVRAVSPGHVASTTRATHLAPGRPWGIVRGSGLGGSSSVNGAYFVRARVEDFDRWSAAGGPAWRHENVLPLLRALEDDLDFPDSDQHGNGGPIPVRRPALEHPAVQALAAASSSLGIAEELDKNDARSTAGFGAVPRNAVSGIRLSTAMTYLAPAMGRPNLTVRGGVTVLGVRVQRGTVRGVDLLVGGKRKFLAAGHVVLSAGAVDTAVLLQRSGIGAARHLERVGIEVQADLPGVGVLANHPQVVVDWLPRGPLPVPADHWFAAAVNLDGFVEDVSVEVLQSLLPMHVLTSNSAPRAADPLPLLVSTQGQGRTGSVAVCGGDPGGPAIVHHGYLADPVERRALREGVRLACQLVAFPAWSGRGGPGAGVVGLPLSVLVDDRALDRWVRERLGTAMHPTSTAAMGPAGSRGSVVNGWGAVHGISGLTVADTSILPTAPRRGPAATAVLIGELVARGLAGRLSSPN